MQRGFYQNNVNSNLTFIQAHSRQNKSMVYTETPGKNKIMDQVESKLKERFLFVSEYKS